MYTMTFNKRKFEPNWFFGTIGGLLMAPAFMAMIVVTILLAILVAPGFCIAMIGARRIKNDYPWQG